MGKDNYIPPAFTIDCRSCGPGGTTVAFYPTKEGLKCIWENENCPYDAEEWIDNECNIHPAVTHDSNYEASDGHNVSLIPWEKLEQLMDGQTPGVKKKKKWR